MRRRFLLLLCGALLLLTMPSQAAPFICNDLQNTCTYTARVLEPSTNSDGTALTDYLRTNMKTQRNAEGWTTTPVPASNANGGGTVTHEFAISTAPCAVTSFSLKASGTDTGGLEGADSSPVTVTRDRTCGGFIETQATTLRPRYTAAQLANLIPSTKLTKFSFPVPYTGTAWRITDATDCGGQDCIQGSYSYWPKLNYHLNSNTMRILVGADGTRGGEGPTLWALDKTTDVLTKLGPLFLGQRLQNANVEGWYWSLSQEMLLYYPDNEYLIALNVWTGAATRVVDLPTKYGLGFLVWQAHSSADDQHHVGTICRASYSGGGTAYCSASRVDYIACFYYNSTTDTFRLYQPISAGTFDECGLTKDGRYTITVDCLPERECPDYRGLLFATNRYFDNTTGLEIKRVSPHEGELGHFATGFGYVAGNSSLSGINAALTWLMPPTAPGPLFFSNKDWNVSALNHLAHTNAANGLALAAQMICGSSATTADQTYESELICTRIDQGGQQLVVAPLMSDLSAPGGCCAPGYSQFPFMSVDVSGTYGIWTSNLRGNRLDAFLVKIPRDRLLTLPPPSTPPTPPANVGIE